MNMGFDNVEAPEEKMAPTRAPFFLWKIGENEYRLKLTGNGICKLEEKFKKNLLMIVADDGIPPLSTMLGIIQVAMQKYNHGITFAKVQEIYDDYTEHGGSMDKLFTEVIIGVMKVSGFFSTEQTAELESEMSNI